MPSDRGYERWMQDQRTGSHVTAMHIIALHSTAMHTALPCTALPQLTHSGLHMLAYTHTLQYTQASHSRTPTMHAIATDTTAMMRTCTIPSLVALDALPISRVSLITRMPFPQHEARGLMSHQVPEIATAPEQP